jgi:hypothetical protein
MFRIKYLLTYFLVTGLLLQSRDLPEKSDTYTVYINFENYSVRANVLYDAKKVKVKTGRVYYWYANNDIKNTDGSFDGKLLHGEYKSFFRDMGLKEQGNFKYGLKEGEWKSWFNDGKIHEIKNFAKGKTDGIEKVYNEQGKIVSRSHFKNGVREGKTIIYKDGKNDSLVIYKNGEVQLPKTPKQKTEKKKKDIPKNGVRKTVRDKDTIAGERKSRNNFKKVFNKTKKSTEKTKPARDISTSLDTTDSTSLDTTDSTSLDTTDSTPLDTRDSTSVHTKKRKKSGTIKQAKKS